MLGKGPSESVFVDKDSTVKPLAEMKHISDEEEMADWMVKARAKHSDFDTLNKTAKVKILVEISGQSDSTIWRRFKSLSNGAESSDSESTT